MEVRSKTEEDQQRLAHNERQGHAYYDIGERYRPVVA
jgi:hypothetical protein